MDIDTLVQSGVTEFNQQNFEKAIAIFQEAIEKNSIPPKNIFLYMGACYLSLEKTDKAIEFLNKAVEENPNSDASYQNLGIAYNKIKDEENALKSFEKTLSFKGRENDESLNKEVVRLAFRAYLFDKTLTYCNKFLEENKEDVFCLRYKAKVYEYRGEIDKALKLVKHLIELDPKNEQLKHLRGLLLFREGTLPEAWGWSEHRWENPVLIPIKEKMKNYIQWTGKENLNGKTLLIYTEQGYGDVFNFFRYIIKLKEKYPQANLLFYTYGNVISLLKFSYDKIEYLKTLPVENFDYWLPHMSLPYHFQTTKETIFMKDAYIKAPPNTYFKKTLITKIGLCWQGNPEHHNDKNRSIPLKLWQPIIENLNAEFVSLQFGESEKEIDKLGWGDKIKKTSHFAKNWIDTASIMNDLDLILSIDSAVAHLAGAMGKKVILLLPCNPDWRWGLKNTQLDWYNSMYIIRQKSFFVWDDTINIAKDYIAKFIEKSIGFVLNLGIESFKQKNYQQALQFFAEVVKFPQSELEEILKLIDIYFLIGTSSSILKDYPQAIKFLEKSIEINPKNIATYQNLSLAYTYSGNTHIAFKHMEKALELDPNNLFFKKEAVRLSLKNYDVEKTLELTENYLKEHEKDTFFLRYKAKAYEYKGEIETAIKITKEILEISPDDDTKKHLLGILYFLAGKVPEAWSWCEYRFKHSQLKHIKEGMRNYQQWSGEEDLNNKTLIIQQEQGYGDALMFFRYVIKLKEKYPNCNIIFYSFSNLISLLKSSYSNIEYRECVIATKNAQGEVMYDVEKSLPEHFDYWIPYMSLPYYFKTTHKTIFMKKSYIKIPENKKLEKNKSKISIGLCWQGNKDHNNDKNRSIPLEKWESLVKNLNAEFVSLQFGEEEDRLNEFSWAKEIKRTSSLIKDWMDTAKIVDTLDYVISIDSAIAHLAGAMGKKGFILLPCNPDWRWGRKETQFDWYDSITIVRQENFFEWEEALKQIQMLFKKS